MKSYVEENFKMLSEICYCIAKQFGHNCEVVLHDLTRSYDNTIVAIYNGQVTGRKVGDGGTNAGLALLRGMKSPKDQICYINTTPDGKILRSTSKYLCTEDGTKIVGSICINFDITDFVKAKDAISSITMEDVDENGGNEVFSGNIDTTLDHMMKNELAKLGKDVSRLTKEEKCIFVHNLDEKGAFLIKKSAGRVADFLGMSRFSIYNYLNQNKEDLKE